MKLQGIIISFVVKSIDIAHSSKKICTHFLYKKQKAPRIIFLSA